jgi:hypothetical protein
VSCTLCECVLTSRLWLWSSTLSFSLSLPPMFTFSYSIILSLSPLMCVCVCVCVIVTQVENGQCKFSLSSEFNNRAWSELFRQHFFLSSCFMLVFLSLSLSTVIVIYLGHGRYTERDKRKFPRFFPKQTLRLAR